MGRIWRRVLIKLTKLSWAPSWPEIQKIAEYYGLEVRKSSPRYGTGIWGEGLIDVVPGEEKGFWHELGHARVPYLNIFSKLYLKLFLLKNPKIEQFQFKTDPRWQNLDYFLNELLATLLGNVLSLKWWMKIKIFEKGQYLKK